MHKRLAALCALPADRSHHRRLSIAGYCAAADWGTAAAKPAEWVEQCLDGALEGFAELKEAADELPTAQRLSEMERLRAAVEGLPGGHAGEVGANVFWSAAHSCACGTHSIHASACTAPLLLAQQLALHKCRGATSLGAGRH